MVESSPLDVSTWIRELGPDLKDSFAPYGPSCIFLTIKLGWMGLFFLLLLTIGFLLGMYFASTE